jgi:hypothetical protein
MSPIPRTRAARLRRTGALGGALGVVLAVFTLAPALNPEPALAATRPFAITESAVALPSGGMRLEAGLSREDWDNHTRIYALSTEFSYSLYANLDLEVEVPWVAAGNRSGFKDGFGDVRARAKINFVKERAAIPLTLSGLVEVKFPTGNTLVSSQEADVRMAGLATKDFGPVTVHGNLFYTFVGDPSGQALNNVVGVSVGLEADTPLDDLTGVGEFIWEQARVPGRDDRLEVMGGGRYALTPGVSLDGTLRVGFDSGLPPGGGAPNYTVAFGFSWDLGR